MSPNKLVYDMEHCLNVAGSIAEAIRDCAKETRKYLYSNQTWRELLQKYIRNLGASKGLIIIDNPRPEWLMHDIRISLNKGGMNEIEEAKRILIDGDDSGVQYPLFIKDPGILPECFRGGIKTIHKVTFNGTLMLGILLFFNKIIADSDLKYSELIMLNIMSTIDTMVTREMSHYIGANRVTGKQRDEIDYKYFFQANKHAIYLFIDIRNFTPLTTFLREFGGQQVSEVGVMYPTITDIITEYCNDISLDILVFGRVDKFIGDGIMAVFGDMKEPIGEEGWARESMRAVCTALRIQNTFVKMLNGWEDRNWLYHHQRNMAEEIAPSLGIGIHMGEATFNFFGPEDHKEFSAIGDSVTLTQRIESMAAKGDRPGILISQPIYYLLQDANKLFSFPIYERLNIKKFRVELKGKGQDYPVWGISGDLGKICKDFIRERKQTCRRCWLEKS
jgi:class 3 adenylate cyclase